MRRSTIFILFGLIVVGAVAGGFVLYRNNLNDNVNTSNTGVVAENSNSTTVSTPPIVKGDIEINKSVNYRGVTFTIDTALKATAYRRTKAADGSQFVVLFLKPFETAPTEDPLGWASKEIRLSGAGLEPRIANEISLPTSAGISGGYLWFIVPLDARNLTLEFGLAGAQQSLALGF